MSLSTYFRPKPNIKDAVQLCHSNSTEELNYAFNLKANHLLEFERFQSFSKLLDLSKSVSEIKMKQASLFANMIGHEMSLQKTIHIYEEFSKDDIEKALELKKVFLLDNIYSLLGVTSSVDKYKDTIFSYMKENRRNNPLLSVTSIYKECKAFAEILNE